MYKIILLFLLLPLYAFTQQAVNYSESVRPGVYRTYEEFLANRPALKGRLELSSDSTATLLIDETGVSKKAGLLWGYSDGHNFYINFKGLHQLIIIGSITVFEISGIPGNENDYMIEYKSGKIVKANSSNILAALASDIELYKDYKRNGDKALVYQYAGKYNERHTVNYPAIAEKAVMKNNSRFYPFGKDVFYFELFGSAILFGSFNYERQIIHSGNFYMMSRIGIGYGYVDQVNYISLPVAFNFLYQFHNYIAAEAGIGINADIALKKYTLMYGDHSYEFHFDPLLNGFAGVRFQFQDGFMLRAGFCPVYDFVTTFPVMKHKFTPYYGVSAGFTF